MVDFGGRAEDLLICRHDVGMLLAWGRRSIELVPLNYQFPDHPGGGGEWNWDANWLVIRGNVRDEDLFWNFEDPCLTTRDAHELLEWLRAVADGRPASRYVDFTEPNVHFELSSRTDREIALLVFFSQESSPPGSDGEIRFGEGHQVSVWLDPESLHRAADQWESELAAFPQRGSMSPPR